MSKWMQKAIEDRARFIERRRQEAVDQQLHSRTLSEKAPAVWLDLANAVKADVDAFNLHCGEEDKLSHLRDRTTGAIGVAREHPFPEAELWMVPRSDGISCTLEVVRTVDSHPKTKHIFLAYHVDDQENVVLRYHGRALDQDQIMELLLSPLVFPLGRPDPA